MKRIRVMFSALLLIGAVSQTGRLNAQAVVTNGHVVTIRPNTGQAKVVCLEVINDNIIRVRATLEEALPQKPASLIVVPQTTPDKKTIL